VRAARTTCERVLAISEAAHSPGHPEVAKALGNLGEAQLRLWELRDARANLERGLAISEEVYGPDHPEVASALVNLGAVQMRLRKLKDARASIEHALAISEEAYGPGPWQGHQDLDRPGHRSAGKSRQVPHSHFPRTDERQR
jgi:Tfp pilus assembly protein PilF